MHGVLFLSNAQVRESFFSMLHGHGQADMSTIQHDTLYTMNLRKYIENKNIMSDACVSHVCQT